MGTICLISDVNLTNWLAVDDMPIEPASDSSESLAKIGTITVTLWRTKVLSSRRLKNLVHDVVCYESLGIVSEKALKGRAVSHGLA